VADVASALTPIEAQLRREITAATYLQTFNRSTQEQSLRVGLIRAARFHHL
jgi:hypothetical protein